MSLKLHWGSRLPLKTSSKSDSKDHIKNEQRSNHSGVQEGLRPKETTLREPHENNECRVLNNMIEIRIVNSNITVMINEKGNLEEPWWIGCKHRVTKWGKREWTWTHEGKDVSCQWMCIQEDYDSEWYRWGEVTLNVNNTERWWPEMPEQICTMTLNAKVKLKKDDGIKCLNEYEKWLWTLKLRKVVTQNTWMNTKNGSERQKLKKKKVMAMDVDMKLRLWTSSWDWITALNTKVQMNNGSECHKGRRMMALNAETKLGIWTPKWRTNGGSKRQTENYGSEHQTETMAMNAKLKKRLWMPNGGQMMALNAKTKLGLWTPKWRTNNGSKRQTENYGSERQIETMALNAKLKKRLCMPNERRMMALNAKRRTTALNAKPRQWLWTPNWKSGSEH